MIFFSINLFCFWYKHKEVFVRWGNTISKHFTVANGVKQGGVTSTILFKSYINKFYIALNSSNTVGYLIAKFYF